VVRLLERGQKIDYLVVESTGVADAIVLTFLRPDSSVAEAESFRG
jgi:G3E family GTPase